MNFIYCLMSLIIICFCTNWPNYLLKIHFSFFVFKLTRVRGIKCRASARRRKGDEFDARPKYHAELGLSDNFRAIKGLVVCNDLDL